jgi:hypothetical protein
LPFDNIQQALQNAGLFSLLTSTLHHRLMIGTETLANEKKNAPQKKDSQPHLQGKKSDENLEEEDDCLQCKFPLIKSLPG